MLKLFKKKKQKLTPTQVVVKENFQYLSSEHDSLLETKHLVRQTEMFNEEDIEVVFQYLQEKK